MKNYGIAASAMIMAVCGATAMAGEAARLSGSLIGTPEAHDGNPLENICDGDLSTSFYALRPDGAYSRPWAGFDLGAPHVVTRIGIAPAASSKSCSRLAVFQGANEADFADAMPIAMVPAEGLTPGERYYIDVEVSRGFRYVRMVGAGGAQMNVAELEFYGTPGEGDDSRFFQVTHLPTIAFSTPGMEEIKAKDDKHPGSTIYVISDNGSTLLTDRACQMKGRGNGSWQMEKKPFQIKFDKKQQILADAPAKAKKWTLINNHGDKTLMRNRVAFDMSRAIGLEYTPYCRFVDVIYNGEYEGCYQLCDQMEVRPGRVDITEMTPDDVAGEALTGGYFLEIDAYADQEISWFNAHHNIPVTIKSPADDEIVDAQRRYIENYFNMMVDAVYASDYTDPERGYRRYLDLDSFLRYFICGELTGNTDTYWSTYMYKEQGSDRFVTGPVWDQDLAFNNDSRTFDVNGKSDFIYCYSGASAAGNMKEFVTRVVKDDPAARRRVSEIWSLLRKRDDFNAEFFNNRIDAYAADLDASQKLNFLRWPILDQWVHMNPRPLYTYEAEVSAVKNYITSRFRKLDELIGIVDVEDESAIAPVTAGTDTSVPAEYFRLDGTSCGSAPSAPGLYILRRGSSASKILVK